MSGFLERIRRAPTMFDPFATTILGRTLRTFSEGSENDRAGTVQVDPSQQEFRLRKETSQKTCFRSIYCKLDNIGLD